MPTRYSVDIPFDKNLVNKEAIKDPVKRKKARFAVKLKFSERYVCHQLTSTIVQVLPSGII
jgi:large subunit ribosomal protein L27e